jgi:hypothetical protein
MVIALVNQARINFSINTRHYTFTTYQQLEKWKKLED